jgi:hypothetical protein
MCYERLARLYQQNSIVIVLLLELCMQTVSAALRVGRGGRSNGAPTSGGGPASTL